MTKNLIFIILILFLTACAKEDGKDATKAKNEASSLEIKESASGEEHSSDLKKANISAFSFDVINGEKVDKSNQFNTVSDVYVEVDKLLKTIKAKGEFESTKQFSERTSIAIASPYSEEVTLNDMLAFSNPVRFKYNADIETAEIMIDGNRKPVT